MNKSGHRDIEAGPGSGAPADDGGAQAKPLAGVSTADEGAKLHNATGSEPKLPPKGGIAPKR